MTTPFSLPAHLRSVLAATPLCLPIAAATPEAMRQASLALLPEFPFQEFRLDYSTGVAQAIAELREHVAAHPEAVFLATCRPKRSGGRLQGSAEDELRLLLRAAHAGFPVLDLSLESAEELGPEAVRQLQQTGATVLVSFHDFERTGDLRAVLARMRPLAPDLYKIVPTAQSLGDCLAVLDLLRSAAEDATPVVAMSMGEAGLLTRVLGPRAGSAFTFGAPDEAGATAPGQVTARTMVDLYRIQHLSSATRVFGVAGDPIRSSLSPLMFNTAFRHMAADAVYLPLLTKDAADLFRLAHELPLEGFSVTMPLKQTILPLLDHIDPLASRIGAVNTVRRTPDGRFRGFNTDAAGIVVPLERRLDLGGAHVLVLGAGGAARAAVFGCRERGAHVSIYNRTSATAASLAREADGTAIERDALATETFDVVINSTPAGMRGNALVLPLEENELRTSLVFDLVYNPTHTPLLAMARAKGIETIPGVEMFVHQGARQYEIWTGEPAPLEPMQHAVLDALKSR